MKIENRMQLHLWREECKEKRQKETCRVLICGGTGCLAGGSDKIYARIKELTANMSNVTVKFGEEIAHVGLKMSGCHGLPTHPVLATNHIQPRASSAYR